MTISPARRTLVAAVAAVTLLTAATPAAAQSLSDRGKRKLPKLFGEATSAVAPSVVRVKVNGRDAALGTVVSADGHIVTKGTELMKGVSFHRDITCVLRDGSAYDAECVGYHLPSDLALLKVNATGLTRLSFSSAASDVGNWVAVPGTDDEPLAVGVVSALPRKLYRDESVIEDRNRGYLGILMSELEDQTGVVITDIEKDTAALRAGLKVRDLIYEVAGKKITSMKAMQSLMSEYRPGDTITLRVKRGEESIDLKVKLGTRSDFNRGDFQNSMGGSLSGRRTGFPKVLQHDTVIRPSDCGGPLVDLDGKVLGINIARAGRVETWALPADVVAPIVQELVDGKHPVPK